jgi:hypothetical protein
VQSGTVGGGRQYRINSSVISLGTSPVTFSDAINQGAANLGATTLASSSVTGSETVGGTLSVTGSETVGGTLSVTGDTTLGSGTGNSHVVNGSATVTSGLTVNAGAGVAGSQSSISGQSLELGITLPGDFATFIDFHARAGSDFDARIIRGAGTGGSLYIINNSGDGGINFAPDSTLSTQFRLQGAGNFSRVIPGGSILYPDFACRAWARFNSSGHLNGGNGTVVRMGFGDYQFNFATPMPHANYSAPTSATNSGSVAQAQANDCFVFQISEYATTHCRGITCYNNTTAEPNNASVSIFI